MEQKIYKLLSEINQEIIRYTGTDMLEDEIIESMEIMDIIVRLEEEFGFEIEPEYIIPEYFKTKEDIVRLAETASKKN